MQKMDGHQYEYKCAKKLKANGFTRVEVTKASADQGIDIIAYKAGKKYGIQCKYYSSPVGNHSVQEAFAGSKFYNCDIAVVMANTIFTKSAEELASKTGVLLWKNGKIPLANSEFRLTKYIGLCLFILGIVSLIATCAMDNVKHPILQTIEATFLIVGGFFGFYERGRWVLSFVSGSSYLIAGFMSLLFSIIVKHFSFFDTALFLALSLISFFRWAYLRKKSTKNCEYTSNIDDISSH